MLGKTGQKGSRAVEDNVKGGKGQGKGPQKQSTKAAEKGKGDSYAKVAADNMWKTKQSKKHKYEKVSPRNSRPLKGIAATVNREIYLQGLDLEGCIDEEDVLESVGEYCMERGIKVIFARIIPVKYDQTRSGCKVTVLEEDFENVVDSDFWPDNITAREWTNRPRDNNGGAARQPSDDEN